MATCTHTGHRRRDVHANVYGKRPCVTHAFTLDAEPADRKDYAAVCGEVVWFRKFNEWGEDAPNIQGVGSGRPVTCKRCLAGRGSI